MRTSAISTALALVVINASPVAAQNFNARPVAAQNFEERWSIIPKAHAEPPPKTDDQNQPASQTQPPSSLPEISRPENRPVQTFSGKASFYSYQSGKTASGLPFDRDLATAAHRSLPFGTRVRVTNLANHKSVVVIINDRGPKVRDRVLDMSLAAARILGITDRGVANIRAEVL